MAEAEDPEVMGDELAIVMFNLYQLGPMGRYIYIYIYTSYIIRYHVMINIYITYIILYLFRTPNCSPQIMMAMESGSQKC